MRELDAAVPTYRALFGQEPLRQQDSATWQLEDGANVTLRAGPEGDGLSLVALRSGAERTLTVLGARLAFVS